MVRLDDGKKLIALARKTIENCFSHKDPIDKTLQQKYNQKQGVFVTLHKYKELRGCIGFPEPIFPLYKAVIEAAKSAAFCDPRFPPLEKDELPKIEIEISILTVPQLIKVNKPEDYLKNIKIGKDGLIVEKGWYKGLLLPQVFTECKATPEEAISMTCEKAGLSTQAWKDPNCKVYKFQAQIFAEVDGKIIERKI